MAKYQAYAEYKDSGVEWLGKVPEHWDVRRLKFSLDLINEKINASDKDDPFLGLENIESWTGRKILSENMVSEGIVTKFNVGDVLFGKLRPYLAKVLLADFSGVATTELLVFRPYFLNGKFLTYYLLNADFIQTVNSSTYGSKMPRANWEYIGALPVLIPPIEEQREIVAYLDRETARIDRMIELNQQTIDKLKEYRTALITAAVTGKIDVRNWQQEKYNHATP